MGVTADNASSNDTMTEDLSDLVAHFGGHSSRVRCVLHITNLVAKSLLRPFDSPKKKGGQTNVGVEMDTAGTQDSSDSSGDDDEGGQELEGPGDIEKEADNLDGWVDEAEELSRDERVQLEAHVRPLKSILVRVSAKKKKGNVPLNRKQVRKLAFKIIHSTTILLPAWKATVEEFQMPVRIIPRDVPTRWNSTFDMADFVLQYRGPIDTITDKRKLKLTDCSLDNDEWVLLTQLRNALKVCFHLFHVV